MMTGGSKDLGPIRGLLFDMGDVLYDATAWRRWLLQLLGRMGLRANYHAFFRIWDRDYLNDVHCGRREYGEAFESFLLAAGLTWGQIDEVEAASQARKRELESSTRPLPGVRSTIERLSAAGLVLAVLSDSESPADQLRARLGRLGLGGRFLAVISSLDLERTKPDPFCYRAALAAMNLTAEEVVFVGHDADELAGARAVGLRTVAFNFEPDVVADRYLDRFEELLGFFECRPARAMVTLGAA